MRPPQDGAARIPDVEETGKVPATSSAADAASQMTVPPLIGWPPQVTWCPRRHRWVATPLYARCRHCGLVYLRGTPCSCRGGAS
jgi:hypothetical protein